MIRIGFCLALIFNSVDASPANTAGLATASSYAVGAGPVAVNNTGGLPQTDGKIGNRSPKSSVNGGAVAEAASFSVDARSIGEIADAPPFRLHGLATMTRFRLTGLYDRADMPHVNRLTGAILSHLRDDAPLTARRILESGDAADYLDPDDLTALRIRVAAGLLSHGQNREALALAQESLDGEDDPAAETLWIAALASYGAAQFDKSRDYFTTLAGRPGEPWGIAAAAFWTARSFQHLDDRDQVHRWLGIAAAQKGTFYGLLAARVLDNTSPVPVGELSEGAYAPRWKPHAGFTIDPALVYAITKQESKFDPEAESSAGAIGLMQIMPHTALQVTQRKDNWDEALFDPEINLDIGQRYVRFLLDSDDVSGSLILMAVAYNGGPTALAHWRRDNDDQDDPLLFLETWPVGETRGFTEQVLTNYWTYRARLGQDTDSLTDLAHARWPLYAPPPAQATVLADLR